MFRLALSRTPRRALVSTLLATVTAAPLLAGAVSTPASASESASFRLRARQSANAAWRAASVAAHQNGKKYVYGGAGPNVFDCSGLVQYSYKQLGIRIPRTADQQYRFSHKIAQSHLRPGDVVFFHDSHGYVYHDAIYAGYGAVWNAPHTGAKVRLQPVWTGSIYFGRFV
jgi:cell wall-associated NlpC family hydrolase